MGSDVEESSSESDYIPMRGHFLTNQPQLCTTNSHIHHTSNSANRSQYKLWYKMIAYDYIVSDSNKSEW